MTAKVYKVTERVTLFRDMDGKIKLARNSDNFVCTLDLSEATDLMDMTIRFEEVASCYITNCETDREKYSTTYKYKPPRKWG